MTMGGTLFEEEEDVEREREEDILGWQMCQSMVVSEGRERSKRLISVFTLRGPL